MREAKAKNQHYSQGGKGLVAEQITADSYWLKNRVCPSLQCVSKSCKKMRDVPSKGGGKPYRSSALAAKKHRAFRTADAQHGPDISVEKIGF